MSQPSESAQIAHILRRTSFGPFAGQVEAGLDEGSDALLEATLAAAPLPFDAPEGIDDEWSFEEIEEELVRLEEEQAAAEEEETGETDDAEIDSAAETDEAAADSGDAPASGSIHDNDHFFDWWIRRMRNPAGGLHEKLTWFWHGHFTTSAEKVEATLLLWRQLRTIHEYALGNFRDFLRAITTDAAMLLYLDGNESIGDNPNENHARELMELFTMGRGNYTEDDVRAGARALSGWWIDGETLDVDFDPMYGYGGSLTFLGTTGRFDVDRVVDVVCDHEATPGFIASKLHHYLVGTTPSDSRVSELARLFRDSSLEIRPLVEDILRHPDFRESRLSRPRYPIEWLHAAWTAAEAEAELDPWLLWSLGQVPYHPPNVAGWPADDRWVSSVQMFTKATMASWIEPPMAELAAADDIVNAALQRCGLYEISDRSRQIIESAVSRSGGPPEDRAWTAMALAMTTPEFSLA